MTVPKEPSSFAVDDLLRSLREAAGGPDASAEVRRIMDAAFIDPGTVATGMPAFDEDDTVLFEDDTVSIWHCRFQPGTAVPPHDHQTSAVIGVYAGVERNDFFKVGDEGGIVVGEAIEMSPGSVLSIGPSAIHTVECTSETPSRGIHVYLGPLTRIERTLFDP